MLLFFLFSSLGLTTHAQNVGVGTQDPSARLHINHVVDDSTLFTSGFEDGTLGILTTFGQGFWEVTSEQFFEGNYSATSGELGDSDTATLQLVIDVPANRTGFLTFMADVESEENEDFLYFTDNGDTIWRTSGDQEWQEVTQVLLDGNHGAATIKWRYAGGGA